MQTSFIPKKPIVSQGKSGGPSTINLFSFVATVIFIVTAALAGSAYAYKSYIQKQIEVDAATLDRARGAFEPELISQLVRLDTRIEAAQQLLRNHLAVTPFFTYLSTITLQTVRFRDFNFTYLDSDKVGVTMRGQAQSYASVALQSDLLDEQKLLRDTLISDISLESTGTISFSVSTTIDPSLVSYDTVIAPTTQTP